MAQVPSLAVFMLGRRLSNLPLVFYKIKKILGQVSYLNPYWALYSCGI
jgi:hypothetical protein